MVILANASSEVASRSVWDLVVGRIEAATTLRECIDAWDVGRRQELSEAERLELVEVVEQAMERVGRHGSLADRVLH